MSFFQRLVQVISGFDTRLANIEKHMQSQEALLRDMNGKMGERTGEITFRGQLRTTPDQIKQALQSTGTMELEEIELEVEFSQAIYMAVAPKHRQKIRELLSDQQLYYLKRVLESHKKLNELADWATNFMKNASSNLEERKNEIKDQITAQLTGGSDSVEAKVRQTAEHYKRQVAKIDKGLLALDEAIAKANASHVKMENTIKTSGRPSNKTFSVGAKKHGN